jgi:hypothetical protein
LYCGPRQLLMMFLEQDCWLPAKDKHKSGTDHNCLT